MSQEYAVALLVYRDDVLCFKILYLVVSAYSSITPLKLGL